MLWGQAQGRNGGLGHGTWLLLGCRLCGRVTSGTSEVERGVRLWEGVKLRFLMNLRNGVWDWGADKASRGLV